MLRNQIALTSMILACVWLGCGDDDDTETSHDPATQGDGGDSKPDIEADSGSKPATDASMSADKDSGTSTAEPVAGCERVVSDDDCDESKRPIVFVHGTFGSATEISNTALLFGSNGYCQDRFVAVEYNSLGGNPEAQLEALVDEVLERTGAEQVDLAGHSQGTGHACTYLSDPARAAKVAHYLNISGGCNGYGVPTLSLSSMNDLGGSPHHSSGDNVTQVTLEQEDHVALSGSRLAFEAMYEYLMDEKPKYTEVQCGDEEVTLDGKSVTFGDNEPNANSTIEVYEVDAQDDPIERGEPVKVIETDENGHFNTKLRRNVRYEFKLLKEDGSLLGWGYQAPFKRSNYLARFLSESANPTIVAASSGQVVRGDGHCAIVARYVAGAFRADWGNSLKIDGEEILTADNAPKAASVIGLFMYDGNEDGMSQLGQTAPMGSFLMGTDVFMDASEPRWMKLEWTNEEGSSVELKIPNRPSSDTQMSVNLPY